MNSPQGSFSSTDGLYPQGQSPWARGSPEPFFAPMNVHYRPMPPARSHMVAAPPPQLFPGNSYALDDPYATPVHLPHRDLPPNDKPYLSTAVVVTAVLALIAQVVVCGVTVLKQHVGPAISVYWIFAFGGGLSSLLSLGGILTRGNFNFASRLGLLLGGCGSVATGVYWFCLHREGAGVLFVGHAILAVWTLLSGEGMRLKIARTDDFSFVQPFLKDEDLEVGR